MRAALSLAVLMIATSAAADVPRIDGQQQQQQPNSPLLPQGQQAGRPILPRMNLANRPEPARCRTELEVVRSDGAQPRLERRASPDNPLFLYAVDTRVDGCRVMLTVDGTYLRPVPEGDAAGEMMPAK